MVKPGGGQRGSDGVAVPVTGVHHDAPGGKGPDLDRAGRGVTRQGMAGTARPISPGGREPVELHRLPPVDKVRQLQRQLWTAAKRSPERRFHALADRIHRGDVLSRTIRELRSMVRRPTVSRVRENRTHGSNGGWGDGSVPRTPRP
jgi:RNA-directed DNA polymerase